jgi:hypothetical protein
VEEDEAPDPTDAGLLCTNAIMLGATGIANAIEQFLLAVPDHNRPLQLGLSLPSVGIYCWRAIFHLFLGGDKHIMRKESMIEHWKEGYEGGICRRSS